MLVGYPNYANEVLAAEGESYDIAHRVYIIRLHGQRLTSDVKQDRIIAIISLGQDMDRIAHPASLPASPLSSKFTSSSLSCIVARYVLLFCLPEI